MARTSTQHTVRELPPRRLRLLEELQALFLEQGFLHFRTGELARLLRCSKRELYALAPSRDALFEMVVERYLAGIDRDMLAAVQRGHNWMEKMIGFMNCAVADTRAASAAFVADLNSFQPGRRMMRRLQRKKIEALGELVLGGTRDGTFSKINPTLVAEVMLLAAERMTDPDFLQATGCTVSEAYGDLFRLVTAGLLPRKPGRAKTGKSAPRGLTNFRERASYPVL